MLQWFTLVIVHLSGLSSDNNGGGDCWAISLNYWWWLQPDVIVSLQVVVGYEAP